MGAPVGAVINGRYRIRSLIGAGGMGAVYEGQQIELRKRVAIKLIAPEFESSPDVLARFRRESRAASRAESENIVQVFDCGHDEAQGYFLVMEFLQGEDLGSLLERRGKLPVEEALGIALQVARGLTKAHEAGVIHRDLKPGNIFLVPREDGQPLVKIVDFGISKVFEDASGATQLTRQGSILGTVQYMSPEQARGEEIDGRSDLWALGCVLYEMLTGQPAIAAEQTLEKTLVRLLQRGARPIREVAPNLDPQVAAMVDEALAFDAKARTATARDMAVQISRVLGRRTTSGPQLVSAPEPEIGDDDATLVGSVSMLAEEVAPDPTEFISGPHPLYAAASERDDDDVSVSPDAVRAARLQLAEAAALQTREASAPGRAARVPRLGILVAVALVAVIGVAVGAWVRSRGPSAAAPAAMESAPLGRDRTHDDVLVLPFPEPMQSAGGASSVAASASAPAMPDLPVDELLRRARTLLERDARAAARYAEEARRKGGGGAALYLLGAAYQSIGQKAAAKQFYRQCAQAKCAQSEECAALAESM